MLAKILGLGDDIAGYLEYCNRLLQDCGVPTDPIETMLIESLALVFHCAGRLHVQSAYATESDASTTYALAAARLNAEFRRGVLALADYRAKLHGKQEDGDGKHNTPAEPEVRLEPSRRKNDNAPALAIRAEQDCSCPLHSSRSSYGLEKSMKSFWTRVQTTSPRGLWRGDRGYPSP